MRKVHGCHRDLGSVAALLACSNFSQCTWDGCLVWTKTGFKPDLETLPCGQVAGGSCSHEHPFSIPCGTDAFLQVFPE